MRSGAETCDARYQVQSGDTLGRIAQAYDIGLRRIAFVNALSNPNSLEVGMVLRIPDQPCSYQKSEFGGWWFGLPDGYRSSTVGIVVGAMLAGLILVLVSIFDRRRREDGSGDVSKIPNGGVA
ncbi:MAG: LysM peptidoglycan-binding domain-containing protein [Myxococcota bacterium]